MIWRPVHLDYILNNYEPLSGRVLGVLTSWIIFIAATIWISLENLPDNWMQTSSDRTQLLQLFLLNPTMLFSLLVMFWFGFEWSFIPVFLSMFIIAVFGHLDPFWGILFGMSFVFGISIYALVYQCAETRYDLRSFKSFFLFVFTSFVASTASSFGAFIWSFSQQLSLTETTTLWNGWWAGTFLQSLFIVGPAIYIFSPYIERAKDRYFNVPAPKKVSIKWVYGAVMTLTIVVSIFILAGEVLGKKRIAEEILSINSATQQDIIHSLESFEIITWISIWIILSVGAGAVLLIGNWNKELKSKVREKTKKLTIAKADLENSIVEKENLLIELHHRVKNNLAVVTALLDLQIMKSDEQLVKTALSDAMSRIGAMASVHEILYQNEKFSKVDIDKYTTKLCNSISETYKLPNQKINLHVESNAENLTMEKAIPMGLVLNELLVNAYKHAFKHGKAGNIFVNLEQSEGLLELKVIDDGVGFQADQSSNQKQKGLGSTIIKTLASQLNGIIDLRSEPGNTSFSLSIKLDA